jgi:hypothetical protein
MKQASVMDKIFNAGESITTGGWDVKPYLYAGLYGRGGGRVSRNLGIESGG